MKHVTAMTLPSPLWSPDIEIEGGQQIVALRNHRKQCSGGSPAAPRVPLTVVNLDLWREGQTVIVKVAFGKVGEVTLRVSLFWARTLAIKLNRALGIK